MIYWRMFIFVAVIAVTGFPLNVGANQIPPNYGHLELRDSFAFNLGIYPNNGTLLNYNTFWNIFTLNNQGQFSNFGNLTNCIYLNNLSGANFINYSGGTVINWQSFSNFGGTVINYGNFVGGLFGRYIQNGGTTINNSNWAQPSSEINSGTLSGIGTFTGAVTSGTGATIHPGDPQGMLTINGTFSSQGTLLIDIGGLEAGKYSLLDVNGRARFGGGTVEFNFIDGYQPEIGNSWDFLFFNTIDGWNTLKFTLEGLGSGYAWETKLSDDRATLFITEAPPAPLPGTLLLFGSGLAMLAVYCRNKLTAKN